MRSAVSRSQRGSRRETSRLSSTATSSSSARALAGRPWRPNLPRRASTWSSSRRVATTQTRDVRHRRRARLRPPLYRAGGAQTIVGRPPITFSRVAALAARPWSMAACAGARPIASSSVGRARTSIEGSAAKTSSATSTRSRAAALNLPRRTPSRSARDTLASHEGQPRRSAGSSTAAGATSCTAAAVTTASAAARPARSARCS